MPDLPRESSTPDAVRVRPMSGADWPEVRAIYAAGIEAGDATFENAPPAWERFDRSKLPDHRFVADDPDGGAVLGWIAVSPVSERAVYRGVVEHSVYVRPDAAGRGVGRALLQALIASCDAAGIWTIQSGVFPENSASLALHERAGFRVVGTRERIGRQQDRWRDVVLLERRSPAVN